MYAGVSVSLRRSGLATPETGACVVFSHTTRLARASAELATAEGLAARRVLAISATRLGVLEARKMICDIIVVGHAGDGTIRV